MLLTIPEVLAPAQAAGLARELTAAAWGDGRVTAGYQSARAKHNRQLPENEPLARELGGQVLAALGRSLLFQSAALPAHIFPPLFNRYDSGHGFGTHVDNAIRPLPGGAGRIRTDLSATLFLSPPEDYDGGELVIDDTFGAQRIKLPAGHLVLYPASSLHQVRTVTRGTRLAAFFWVQSLVRDDAARTLLFDLDMAIQRLRADVGDDHAALVSLTGVYHNLLRRWASP